jgi:hypothetical protein
MINVDPEKLNDDQLDALIRDVVVPNGLSAELRDICNEPTKKAELRKPYWRHPAIVAISTVAAVIVLLAAGYFWWPENPALFKEAAENNKSQSQSNDGSSSGEMDSKQAKINANELIQQMTENDQKIDAILYELKKAQLMRERNMETAAYRNELDPTQVHSLIFAMGDHSQLLFGGSKESVASDLTLVIEKYPDSIGARYAKKTIEQLKLLSQ